MFLINEGLSCKCEDPYRACCVIHRGASTGDKHGKGLPSLLIMGMQMSPDNEIVVLPIKWVD